MSHSISIDITSFDLMDENKIIGTSNVTDYNLTTWPEFVMSFVHALRAAGFQPEFDDMVGVLEQCFPSEPEACESCSENPRNYVDSFPFKYGDL